MLYALAGILLCLSYVASEVEDAYLEAADRPMERMQAKFYIHGVFWGALVGPLAILAVASLITAIVRSAY